MASKIEFVEYVADQLRDAGTITYKKMFGEYGLYCDGKIFAVVCKDQLFVKITEMSKSLILSCRRLRLMRARKTIFSLKMWRTRPC